MPWETKLFSFVLFSRKASLVIQSLGSLSGGPTLRKGHQNPQREQPLL